MSGCDHLVVLVTLVLDNKFDLILKAQQEEDSLLAGDTIHLHIIDLERQETVNGGVHREK